jgi:RNA polymerase sigma-70 factor (ECF subfamily)
MGMSSSGQPRMEQLYEELRPAMIGIAYRMLGSVSEAEDVVQDAFLRLDRARAEEIESPRAYMTTVVTRLAIDQLRSARVTREQYVGAWLPEPLVAEAGPGPADAAETADTLSMAFLVLLESLSPVERAVFLLREVFGYDYAEVARVVERSEDNCRQIAARARKAIEARRPRFEPSYERREELVRQFLAAATEGDTEGLIGLLAEDVEMQGDGGGKAPALRKPAVGPAAVARVLVRLGRQAGKAGIRGRVVEVNGSPGLVFEAPDGALVNAVALDVVDGHVSAVRSVVNPDKLRHLGPVADLPALLRGARERRGG